MSMADEYKVGDVMILVHDRHDPVMVSIDRLTKTQIIVRDPQHPDDPKQVLRFERECGWSSQPEVLRCYGLVGHWSRHCSHKLYDYSVEAMTVLMEQKERQKQLAAKRQTAEEKRRWAAEEQRAIAMAEVKSLVGGQAGLTMITKLSMTNPDGSRLYVFSVPVKPEYSQQKKSWEVVILHCKDVEELEVKMVEYDITYMHGGCSSFPSCSSLRAKSDDEAKWEAVRYCYTSW